MRGFLKIILLSLVVLASVAFFAQGSLANFEKVIKAEMSPCNETLHYYIASIDPKFGLTQDDVLKDVSQAASVWNKAAAKNLFAIDVKGDLPIYFVYDKRQALNSQINQLEKKLNTGGATLDKQLADYKQKVADYEARLKAYNDEVASWNAKGGAPEEDYKRLQETSSQLKTEGGQLKDLAKQLNIQAKDYNSQVGNLNSTINSFNQALTLQPEEGIYIEEKSSLIDSGKKKIEIYFVPSQDELIHTLTHELGHSLHIDHNDNPKSIMYAYTSQSLNLSQDDLSSLKNACKTKTLTQVLQEKLKIIQGNYNSMFQGSLSQ